MLSAFNYHSSSIFQAKVLTSLSYGSISYRDVEEIMKIRGVEVDHATIQRWVYKFMPEIELHMIKKNQLNNQEQSMFKS